MKSSIIIITYLALLHSLLSGEESLNALEQQFIKADLQNKYAIVDSCFNSNDSLSINLIKDLLTSNKLARYFMLPDVYTVFQNRIAESVIKDNNVEFIEYLYQYYYGDEQKRMLTRPTNFSLDDYLDHNSLGLDFFPFKVGSVRTVDSSGITWALFNRPEFGCHQDLWLTRKSPEKEFWDGPWFTGIVFGVVPDDSSSVLNYENGLLRFISSDGSIDTSFSPDDFTRDSDNDGLYDIEEMRFMTDPDDEDTDSDGIIDGEDMNPLASGKRELTGTDWAKLAVFRSAQVRYSMYNVYYIAADSIDVLEYYSPTENPIIISCDPERRKKINEYCDGFAFLGRGAIRLKFNVIEKSEDVIEVRISDVSTIQGYKVEKVNGIWIITERLETIDISRAGYWW